MAVVLALTVFVAVVLRVMRWTIESSEARRLEGGGAIRPTERAVHGERRPSMRSLWRGLIACVAATVAISAYLVWTRSVWTGLS